MKRLWRMKRQARTILNGFEQRGLAIRVGDQGGWLLAHPDVLPCRMLDWSPNSPTPTERTLP